MDSAVSEGQAAVEAYCAEEAGAHALRVSHRRWVSTDVGNAEFIQGKLWRMRRSDFA